MKLNKPKVTDTQTELENYVANLLVDSPCQVKQQEPQKKEENSVTSLHDEQQRLTEFVSGVSSENVSQIPQDSVSLREQVSQQVDPSDNKKIFIKETKTDKIESSVSVKPLTKGSSGDVISLTKKVKKSKLIRDKLIEKPNLFEQQANKEPSSVVRAVEPSNKISNENDLGKTSIEASDRKHHEKVNREVEDYSKRTYKEPEQTDPRLDNVEKLLAKIALANVIVAETKTAIGTEVGTENDRSGTAPKEASVILKGTSPVVEPEPISLESAKPSFEHRESSPLKEHLGNVFQTLVFDVNKLPLAVPLVKLGGIVNVSQLEITPLVGTPDWFMGLVPNERGNLMVVDTQKFLMPERPLSEEKSYQYLIILDDSQWALACHSVGDAKNLSPDDVRWSSGSSKRPWFAGMVVEYMSALIEVDELINMLADNIVD